MFNSFKGRSRWVCLLILININLAPTQLMAAENPVQSSNLEKIVTILVARNPSLLSLRLRASASEALVESAGALEDPRVTYSIAPSSFGDTIPSGFGNAVGVRQNFQLSQSMPWPGKRQLRVEKMVADTSALDRRYEGSRNALIAQVRSVWAQWWYVHSALDSNDSLQQLISEQHVVAQTRYANGLGLQQDLLKIQTFDLQLQHQHLVLEQERMQLQSQLNYLLDQSSSTPLPRPVATLAGPELAPRKQLETWLLEGQPSLLELQANVQSAQIEKRLTEKDDYPDMQFSLGYNELWNDPSQRLQVGVSVNIPLDFGKRTARKSSADYSLHSVKLEVQNKRNELLSLLESQLSSYAQTAHKILLIETELLPSSTRLIAASLADYESGRGDFNELVDAQEELLNTQLLLRSTYAEKFMALAQIDKLTGGRFWPIGDNNEI